MARSITSSLRALRRTTTTAVLIRPTAAHSRQASSNFLQERPSPPRLPAEQQAEFERLQRAAEAQLHSHTNQMTETPAVAPLATSRHVTSPTAADAGAKTQETNSSDGLATLSGGIRKGAPPEFEGEKNPKTGEIGGPKNEPLRWGAQGDWSFNGRVTDF